MSLNKSIIVSNIIEIYIILIFSSTEGMEFLKIQKKSLPLKFESKKNMFIYIYFNLRLLNLKTNYNFRKKKNEIKFIINYNYNYINI